MFAKIEMAEYLLTVMNLKLSTLMRKTAAQLWDLVDHYTTPSVTA